MKTGKRLVVILDGVGCAELPDADRVGDSGSNTLGNLSRIFNGLKLPSLQKLGLVPGVKPD